MAAEDDLQAQQLGPSVCSPAGNHGRPQAVVGEHVGVRQPEPSFACMAIVLALDVIRVPEIVCLQVKQAQAKTKEAAKQLSNPSADFAKKAEKNIKKVKGNAAPALNKAKV